MENGSFTEEQIKSLIRIMIQYQFDGEMHTKDFVPTEKTTWQRFCECVFGESLSDALKHNFLSSTAAYQILNLLEVAAPLLAAWIVNPNYKPSPAVFAALTLPALATMRNSHFYAGITKGVSHDEIHRQADAVKAAVAALEIELNAVSDDNAVKKTLLSLLTRPSANSRALLTACLAMSCFVKIAASEAAFFEEFKDFPKLAVFFMAMVPGSFEALNVTNIGYLQIGAAEHEAIKKYWRGVIPSVNPRDLAPVFSRIAEFPLFPFMMSELGALLWAVVKYRAAMTLAALSNSDANNVAGGLGGYDMVMAMSAFFASSVFTRYSVDQKLARGDINRFKPNTYPKAFISALPLAGFVGFIFQSLINSGAFAAPEATRVLNDIGFASAMIGLKRMEGIVILAAMLTLIPATIAIRQFEKFADWYRYFMRFNFVADWVKWIDNVHLTDKKVATAAGAGLITVGMASSFLNDKTAINHVVTGAGQSLFFVSATAWLAENHRVAANRIRFIPIQAALYAMALTAFMLNFVWTIYNWVSGHELGDHPTKVSHDTLESLGKFVSQYGYWIYGLVAFGVGALAGTKDFAATAAKLPIVTDQVSAVADRRSQSYASSAVSFVGAGLKKAQQYIATRCAKDETQESLVL